MGSADQAARRWWPAVRIPSFESGQSADGQQNGMNGGSRDNRVLKWWNVRWFRGTMGYPYLRKPPFEYVGVWKWTVCPQFLAILMGNKGEIYIYICVCVINHWIFGVPYSQANPYWGFACEFAKRSPQQLRWARHSYGIALSLTLIGIVCPRNRALSPWPRLRYSTSQPSKGPKGSNSGYNGHR